MNRAAPSAQVLRLVPRTKPLADPLVVATSLHIDITRAGNIACNPLVVHPNQALALLRLLLPAASHVLTVHGDGESA